MFVTNIEPQKRSPNRVSVYLDNEFAFGIHIDVLTTYGLRKGDELNKETIDTILRREEFNLAKDHALRYLSYRRRSEKEVRSKLTEKAFDPSTIDTVIEHLRSLNMLNDVEFAKAFVHDALLRKPSGKKLLRRQLLMKGIQSSVIQTVLAEEISEQHENDLALREAKKIASRFATSRKTLELKKQQQRLAQHLARRGFSWGVILPIVKKIFDTSPSAGKE